MRIVTLEPENSLENSEWVWKIHEIPNTITKYGNKNNKIIMDEEEEKISKENSKEISPQNSGSSEVLKNLIAMKRDSMVIVKNLPGNIISLNFSEQAFIRRVKKFFFSKFFFSNFFFLSRPGMLVEFELEDFLSRQKNSQKILREK